ncbi:hypothetical protein BJX62DRAFT_233794 [Aspergillus germanicus]
MTVDEKTRTRTGRAEPTLQQSSTGDIDIEMDERSKTNSSPGQLVMERLDTWFDWEILGLVASVGVLIALAIVLGKYDRKPQPNWRYMSLNSLISWLSTIFRACIILSSSQALGQLKWVWFAQGEARPVQELRVYDDATRGPYEAMEFIWTLRARHFAVFGSLAVILAIAIDRFAQNLIYHYEDMTEDPSQQALLAAATYYNSSDCTVSASWGLLA